MVVSCRLVLKLDMDVVGRGTRCLGRSLCRLGLRLDLLLQLVLLPQRKKSMVIFTYIQTYGMLRQGLCLPHHHLYCGGTLRLGVGTTTTHRRRCGRRGSMSLEWLRSSAVSSIRQRPWHRPAGHPGCPSSELELRCCDDTWCLGAWCRW